MLALIVDEVTVVYHDILTLVDHSVALPDAIRTGTFTAHCGSVIGSTFLCYAILEAVATFLFARNLTFVQNDFRFVSELFLYAVGQEAIITVEQTLDLRLD